MRGRERTVLTEGFRRCARPRYTVIPLRVPEWRNWQTRGTQNPERLTPREGSTPSSGTIKSIPFRHLRRPRLHTAPCAKTAVGQPWGNSRENHDAGQGGPTRQRTTYGLAAPRPRHAGQRDEARGRCRDGALLALAGGGRVRSCDDKPAPN